MTASLPETRLYLELTAVDGARARLEAALAAAPIEAVLIRPGPGGKADRALLQDLVAIAQSRNAAALIENDIALARSLKADGVHLGWSTEVCETYAEARKQLGDRQIVGAMAGASRHDAMTLAEAGADYIGFGIGPATAAERHELVDWWAEAFVIPCVATGVTGAADAAELASVGADFVGISANAGETPADIAARLRGIVEAVDQVRSSAKSPALRSAR